jgi:iron complex transport system substrate-binding protein
LTAGAGTLADDVLRRAGFASMAAETGIVGWRWIDIETVLTDAPDVLVMESRTDGPPSIGRGVLSHPALAAFADTRSIINLPKSQWECAGPDTVRAAELLAQARVALEAQGAVP